MTTHQTEEQQSYKERLLTLQSLVLDELIARLSSGSAKGVDIANAIKFLTQDLADPEAGKTSMAEMDELAASLPFTGSFVSQERGLY